MARGPCFYPIMASVTRMALAGILLCGAAHANAAGIGLSAYAETAAEAPALVELNDGKRRTGQHRSGGCLLLQLDSAAD